jgi:hypothetical protein
MVEVSDGPWPWHLQELMDQLEASVAAPSASPESLLDAATWTLGKLGKMGWERCFFEQWL